MNQTIIAYISDGGIQEEISQGSGRIAGALGLDNLIMFYDSNDIQLSTETKDVSIEDTAMKYEAWGWNVLSINGNDPDEIRAAIKEAQAEKEQTKLARKALEEFKASVIAAEEEDDKIARKMAKLQERKERKKQKQNAPASKQVFNRDVIEAGDNVRLKGQVSAGTVMEVQGKQAVVAFGMIKSTVKLEQLEKVSKGQIKKEIQKSTFVSVQTADDMHEKKLNFKQEIDVRGMRGDDALQAVTYFVDDAIQVGAARIRILHGTGTGILRQLIRDYLHTVPGVRQYHDEHVQFGGAGITVVELE